MAKAKKSAVKAKPKTKSVKGSAGKVSGAKKKPVAKTAGRKPAKTAVAAT